MGHELRKLLEKKISRAESKEGWEIEPCNWFIAGRAFQAEGIADVSSKPEEQNMGLRNSQGPDYIDPGRTELPLK